MTRDALKVTSDDTEVRRNIKAAARRLLAGQPTNPANEPWDLSFAALQRESGVGRNDLDRRYVDIKEAYRDAAERVEPQRTPLELRLADRVADAEQRVESATTAARGEREMARQWELAAQALARRVQVLVVHQQGTQAKVSRLQAQLDSLQPRLQMARNELEVERAAKRDLQMEIEALRDEIDMLRLRLNE
jgi:chromosome segregation ATPase